MPLLSNLMPAVWERLALRLSSTQPIGLTTGIPELDSALGEGWNRQELTYLAGSSGIGKSWLSLHFVLTGAQWLHDHSDQRPLSGYLISRNNDEHAKQRQQIQDKEGKQPLIVLWSLEMAEMAVAMRATALTARLRCGVDLDSAALRVGKLPVMPDDPAWPEYSAHLEEAYMALRGELGPYVYIEFDDRNTGEFCETLDELTKDHDIVFVVVDYFRLIEEFQSDGSMANAQAQRSMQLTQLAKYYDCHVLAVFDITRLGQQAERVGLQHMKGGTAAQYDADVVLVLNEHERGGKEKDVYERHGVVELMVAKNRFGVTKTIQLQIDRGTGLIEPVHRSRFGEGIYRTKGEIATP